MIYVTNALTPFAMGEMVPELSRGSELSADLMEGLA